MTGIWNHPFSLHYSGSCFLKINFSKENKNETFLSQYPAIEGYPHFFVLDKDGNLLHSQNTGDLEKDKDYDKEKFIEFLNKWKP